MLTDLLGEMRSDLKINVGLTMVEGGWDGGTGGTKREAEEMNMTAK